MEKTSRVDRILGLTGMSRADARRCVAQGRVAVSGRVVRDPGAKAMLSEVTLDGAALDAEEEVYLMLNKPAGVITATEDARLLTVMTLLPEKYARRGLGPVGRLDRDVTGLVIMTTDGELAHRLISPKFKAEKRYRALCEGRLDDRDAAAFEAGIQLSDFQARPAKLVILSASDGQSEADVILTEGKFHQVKRMFAAVGHPLIRLRRLSIGTVELDEALEEGAYRPLTEEEIRGLREQAGLC